MTTVSYHFCFGAPEFSDTGHLDIVSKRQAQRDSSSHSVEKALHTQSVSTVIQCEHKLNIALSFFYSVLIQLGVFLICLVSWSSDSEDFQAVVVADSNPVGLGGGPLDVIDLSLGRVGQYRVLDGPRHLLDVPD